jgi:hypothetical protein
MHWHKDAWNFVAHGQKRWYMLPPAHTVYGTAPVSDWVRTVLADAERAAIAAAVAAPAPTAADGGRSGDHAPNLHAHEAYTRHLLECTQGAGDVAYVPHGWGHAVLNLHTTVGVAVEFSAALARY